MVLRMSMMLPAAAAISTIHPLRIPD